MTDKTEQMFAEILGQLKIMNELFVEALGNEKKKPKEKKEPAYKRYNKEMLALFEDGEPRHIFGVMQELRKLGFNIKSEASLNNGLLNSYHAGKLDKVRKGVYIKKGLGSTQI